MSKMVSFYAIIFFFFFDETQNRFDLSALLTGSDAAVALMMDAL